MTLQDNWRQCNVEQTHCPLIHRRNIIFNNRGIEPVISPRQSPFFFFSRIFYWSVWNEILFVIFFFFHRLKVNTRHPARSHRSSGWASSSAPSSGWFLCSAPSSHSGLNGWYDLMSPFGSDILDLVHTYYVVLFPFPKLYLKRRRRRDRVYAVWPFRPHANRFLGQ